MSDYNVGQKVFKGAKFHGTISEILDEGRTLVVALGVAKFSGSDQYDDAGIVKGTKMKNELISPVQIAGDSECQVPTYTVRS